MNLLFRVVYAAHANGTHHKLALDALRYLECDDAPSWRTVFLKHIEAYLEGSKAPDKEFKDFKNHVLHVRDNYWGGAPEKAESWYQLLVRALREENFGEAAWCAGVLSHYYTDPIHPFHTTQSEAESNIHRAVEWSISKSYNEIRQTGLKQGLPEIDAGSGETWLKDMVIAGAELSNRDYETLIARYNFDIGVVDPPGGLDDTCRDLVGRLVVYASCGFARILDRAIAEAGVEPPSVNLTLDSFLATLKIPVKWVARKMSDAAEARAVESMFDELQATGRVDQTLSEDDRTVRDLHAKEVVAPEAERRRSQRQARRNDAPLPQGNFPRKKSANKSTTQPPRKLQEITASQIQPADLPITQPLQVVEQPVAKPEKRPQRPYLQLADDVEAAPSIGPKTADRLLAVGVQSIDDLLKAKPEELAEQLATRHIRPATITDWQDQTRLMLEIPGLRVTHSQLFVGAGFRSVEEIAFADPADIMAGMLKFAGTREGQRILGNGTAPDLEAITGWVNAAGEAIAA